MEFSSTLRDAGKGYNSALEGNPKRKARNTAQKNLTMLPTKAPVLGDPCRMKPLSLLIKIITCCFEVDTIGLMFTWEREQALKS